MRLAPEPRADQSDADMRQARLKRKKGQGQGEIETNSRENVQHGRDEGGQRYQKEALVCIMGKWIPCIPPLPLCVSYLPWPAPYVCWRIYS